MNSPKRGLGRGLGALIPGPHASRHATRPMPGSGGHSIPATERAPVVPAAQGRGGSPATVVGEAPVESLNPERAGAYFSELPLTSLRPNPRQPRTEFDEDAMSELVASITAVGLLQPVVVRPVGQHFELVMGERRWRAAAQAGLATIPAVVRETADHDLLRDALLENIHRASLNPLEEAAAYQQLLDDFGATHEELAVRVGRSRPHISNTLRLLTLPPAVQRRVAAGVLSAGHARALAGLDSPGEQERLASRVVAEGLSVRTLEELVATGEQPTATGRQRARATAPGLTEIADRLSERFDTRCRVELGRRKGKIVIEFASLDDMHRVLSVLDSARVD